MRKHRGFTAVAVLTIALGIGVNTALFTVFDAFVLKPLPLRDPSRLVALEGRDKQGLHHRLFSYLDYLDYRQQDTTFSDLVAWNKVAATYGEAPPPDADDYTLAAGYEHVFGQIVSTNYFSALGAQMKLGRGFTANEDLASESSVVVLNHAYWERRFNSDVSIVGRTIELQGHTFTVIGVTEPGFIGTTPDSPSFWAPLMARDYFITSGGWAHETWLTDRDAEVFTILGRLAPNVSESEALAAAQLTTDRLAQKYPSENRKTSLELLRAGTFVTLDEDLSALVWPLAIGFGLVLLVACANVANLLLARALDRQKEIGVRLALGAQRSRVIGQLLTESVLLALLGGAAGLLVAVWTLRALYPIVLSSFPVPELAGGFALNLTPDWRVFMFTLFIAVVAGTAAGLAPAIQMSRPDVITALKSDVSHGYLNNSRVRSGLVVVQIAVSLSLLIGAGLLAMNVRRLHHVDTGMNLQNVFSVAAGLSGSDRSGVDADILRQRLADRLRELPDVASVSECYNQPFSGNMGNRAVLLQNGEPTHPREVGFNYVSTEYFQTLSIPILRGRAFTAEEVRSRLPVVVVSETAAKQFWPDQDPLGQQLEVAADEPDQHEQTISRVQYRQYQVIGVARDTRSRHLWQQDERFVYLPLPVAKSRYLLVQTRGNSAATMSAVRGLATSTHPALRTSVRALNDNVAAQAAPFRALAWVSGALGALALVLAALGLYGVTSFIVTRRTREIGIRMALGARRGDVIALFLRGGWRLTALGIGLGLAGGAVLSRLLVSVLVDLSALDPLVLAFVSLFLFLVATFAILAATRRATKVDPMVALRYE
ncbi:MAG TPA: ABC transporter permease [Pyrinomonadaceae bacterium]|nr:ABC transporter permease [Pyrinomonadaceae bacterium]